MPASADDDKGLSADEAAAWLARYGRNEIVEQKPGWAAALAIKLWAPVPWMLETAVILQVFLGEYLEAGIILGLLVFNALLAFAQESRAHNALEALKSRLALTASVRRDGVWETRPVAELVPDDIVKLSLGAVVPADVRLISGGVLLDQSMLTGESLPVEAGPGARGYAGALVRRGEATAQVIATGAATYFGRTAELVRIAHVESGEQRAVLGVVRNLAVLNGALVVLMVGDAYLRALPLDAVITLVLTAILATVPVALPATFTLAAALGAQRLVRRGVLPTRLTAVNEAATMDVLLSDKTGTLTKNTLSLVGITPFDGSTEAEVLAYAAAASGEAGADPVDAVIRAAAATAHIALPERINFVPFDPASKLAEAVLSETAGKLQVIKGAFAAVAARAMHSEDAEAAMQTLAAKGARVLAVAVGPARRLRMVGLLGLADPPREDAAGLIAALANRGVRTVMVTGDAPQTAAVIAREVGLTGPVCPADRVPAAVGPDDYAVFAGLLPEDKYRLVKAFQARGHKVGMCGDGANDAPALRQAGIGIAVATATDVAKAAAGIVLTEPGLAGILAAVEEGRATFARLRTYTLTMLVRKIVVVAYLFLGLLLVGRAVLTPTLMVLFLLANDFLTMSLTADRASASQRPNAWRMGGMVAVAAVVAVANLGFVFGSLAWGRLAYAFDLGQLRTLSFVVLVASTQATLYALRGRGQMWSSRPGAWVIFSSVVDLAITLAVALSGALSPALPVPVLAGWLVAAGVFALALGLLKAPLFALAGIA
jgi:H+-transporting ATPase